MSLRTERLGPLPVVNHFLERLGLLDILDRFVPTEDQRVRLRYSLGLGVLLRSILVEREPIYRQHETVDTFAAGVFGLTAELQLHLCDDAIGNALDHLFDADRASLLTEVVVAATRQFDLSLDELHNDATSVRFCGQGHGHGFGHLAESVTVAGSRNHVPYASRFLSDTKPDEGPVGSGTSRGEPWRAGLSPPGSAT